MGYEVKKKLKIFTCFAILRRCILRLSGTIHMGITMSKELKAVAEYILWFAGNVGSPITNLKLQKLVYYAQAWYLALYEGPLFPEPIEAWVHGPVVDSLYKKYKKYGRGIIPPPKNPPSFNNEVAQPHLNEIMDVFLELDAFTLQRLAHQEEPWQEARQGLAYDDLSRREINEKTMERFYQSLVEEQSEES